MSREILEINSPSNGPSSIRGMFSKDDAAENISPPKREKPSFKLKSTLKESVERELRDLRELAVSDPELAAKGKAKWRYINNKLGMEAHHITPIHISSKLQQSYLYTVGGKPRKNGWAKWLKRVEADAKKHMYHGNDPRNIVAARGSVKIPTTPAGKRSLIYHRAGVGDNLGYHALEKKKIRLKGPEIRLTPDRIDTTPYRDLMAEQAKRLHLERRKLENTLLDVKVFDGPTK